MERVFRPALLHLADRIAARLRAKSRPGRTVTVRVRFADMQLRHALGDARSADLGDRDAGRDRRGLVRAVLGDHPQEKTISLLAISVSHLEEHWDLALELAAWPRG